MDRRKIYIRLYDIIAFLQGMVFYAPIATLYRQAHGLSVFDITLIESISFAVAILLEVPWGFVSDKIGYRKTILVCNILYVISKIVFWKANGFGMFLLERLILSVVTSGLSGCDSAYLYLLADKKGTQKEFGYYEAMTNSGLIAASFVYSLFIRNNYGLSAFLTVLTYVAAMFLSFILPETKPERKIRVPFLAQIKELAGVITADKSILLFLVSSALLSQCVQTITVFLNQLQYIRSGISAGSLGFLYAVTTAAGLSCCFSHRLTECFGKVRFAGLLLLLSCFSCLAMAFFPFAAISVIGIILLKVSSALYAPLSLEVQNRQITSENRATVLSAYAIFMDLLSIGTNLILGRLSDIGVNYAMAAGALLCLLGLIFIIFWQYKIKIR